MSRSLDEVLQHQAHCVNPKFDGTSRRLISEDAPHVHRCQTCGTTFIVQSIPSRYHAEESAYDVPPTTPLA